MIAFLWATFFIYLGMFCSVGGRRVAVFYVVGNNAMGQVGKEPITLFHSGQKVVLICHTTSFERPAYSWLRWELGLWKKMKTQENFAVVDAAGSYRCSVQGAKKRSLNSTVVQVRILSDLQANKVGKRKPDVTDHIMMRKVVNSTKLVPAKTSHARFLIEPKDLIVQLGKPFLVRCRLNVPVLACVWFRQDLEKRSYVELPEETRILGSKSNGSCTFRISKATSINAGTWTCQSVIYNGTRMQSRAGSVTIQHPPTVIPNQIPEYQHISSSFPEKTGSVSAILGRSVNYKPILRINNQQVEDGQVLILNKEDIYIKSVEVRAECSAYTPVKYSNMRWKLGNAQARTFATVIKRVLPASKQDSGDDLFLMTSTVSFTLRVTEKTKDKIKTAVVPIMCTAEDRWVRADPDVDSSRKHVTGIQLTLNHPVSDVAMSIESSSGGVTKILCSTNGYPLPNIRWQTKGSGKWSDVKGATGPTYTTDVDAEYRCTARNELNSQDESIHSASSRVSPKALSSSNLNKPSVYIIAIGLIISILRFLL